MPTINLEIIPPTATSQENQTAFINGRIMHYKKKSAKDAFRILTEALRPYAPIKPMDGPIALYCGWRFPKGKSHKDGEWKITRPDTDNLQKALKDVMTRLGFWVDDSRVCQETVIKVWSDDPGITIDYREVDEVWKSSPS